MTNRLPQSRMARDCKPLSEQCHHGLCRTDVNARAFLNIEAGHLAALNDYGKPLAAGSQTKSGAIQLKARGRGQFAIVVGEHDDLVGILRFAPRAHDKSVVNGHADNAVDTLALDGVCIDNVTGQLRHGAAWGESARYGKQQDFLNVHQV